MIRNEFSNLELLLAALPSRDLLEGEPFPLLRIARLLRDFLSGEDYSIAKNVLKCSAPFTHRMQNVGRKARTASYDLVSEYFIDQTQKLIRQLNNEEKDTAIKEIKESYLSQNYAYAERLFNNYRIFKLQEYADSTQDLRQRLHAYLIQTRLYHRASTLQNSVSSRRSEELLTLAKTRITKKIEALAAEEF